MKSKCLNKKQFLAVLDSLEKQYDKDDRIDAFISKEFYENSHFFINELHQVLWNQLVQLLCDSFPQPKDNFMDDIHYFIYDLEFGRRWETGMIVDKYGTDIDLSSSEKLWNYLTGVKNA